MLRRDHCISDDELLDFTEHRPVYDTKKPAEVCITVFMFSIKNNKCKLFIIFFIFIVNKSGT